MCDKLTTQRHEKKMISHSTHTLFVVYVTEVQRMRYVVPGQERGEFVPAFRLHHTSSTHVHHQRLYVI